MDTRIATSARPDVVMIESTARPTPAPPRVSFGQVLAAGVNGLVQGAELAASRLPGSPITATAVRGGQSVLSATVATPSVAPLATVGGVAVNTAAEGPGGTGSPSPIGGWMAGIGAAVSSGATGGASGTTLPAGATDATGGIDSSLQQSAQLNLYYLQVQEQVDAQNRSFTTLSNVLKTEHDTAKGAISNIHS